MEEGKTTVTCPMCGIKLTGATRDLGSNEKYAGTGTEWECGACEKRTDAERWFEAVEAH